jgi:hypothetical protein
MQNNQRQEQLAAMLARILKRLRPAKKPSTDPKPSTRNGDLRETERMESIIREPVGGHE